MLLLSSSILMYYSDDFVLHMINSMYLTTMCLLRNIETETGFNVSIIES